MKKNRFFSSVGAKLALAAMALTSVLFASCEQEDFDATFELDPAKATIAVSMIDVEGGAAMSGFTVSASTGEVSGTTVTITGDAATKKIAAQTVDVTVTYEGISGKAPVAIPNLAEGTVGNYSVTFLYYKGAVIVGPGTTVTIDTDYEIVSEKDADKSTVEAFYATTGNYTHTHNGIDSWFTNETDYIITANVKYNNYKGVELVSVDEKVSPLPTVASSFVSAFENQKIEKISAVFSFKVSAWSIYNAWVEKTTDFITYTINKVETTTTEEEGKEPVVGEPKKTEIAVITVKSVNTTIVPREEAHPNHSHAYIPGHGHDHGHGGDNAGGGIVIAD